MLPKKLIKEDRFERKIEYKLSEKETCKTFLKEYNKKNKNDYRFVRPVILLKENLLVFVQRIKISNLPRFIIIKMRRKLPGD